MSKEFIIYVKGNANTSNLKKIAIFFVILNIKDNLYQFYHAYLPYRFSANTYILQTFFQNTRQGFLLKFRQNPTFGTLFSKAPKNRGLLPSIAFSGAKHCFSPRKALLFHIRSIAWLLFCLFSLQNQVQKCSKLLIFL